MSVTEPGLNKYPFTPGEHLVECQIEEMPDTVMYYLDHGEEWQKLSDNTLQVMEKELTLERSVATLLDSAQKILSTRHPEANSQS